MVSFSPEPPGLKTTTVFKVAMALNLPAIFCGVLIGIPLVLLGLVGSDPLWIGIGALLGIVMWRQIGRWVDEQFAISRGIMPRRSRPRVASTLILRLLVFLFLLMFVSGLMLNHHRTMERDFLYCTWIVWSAAYLFLSFWGESRETKLARVIAEPPSAHRL